MHVNEELFWNSLIIEFSNTFFYWSSAACQSTTNPGFISLDNGEGYSLTESLRFLEEVANASLGLSNVIANSSWYGAEVLIRHGSPELKKKYLPSLHSGTSICALCVADSEAGSDANSSSVSILQGW